MTWRVKPLLHPFRPWRSVACGAIAASGAALLLGSWASAGQSRAIAQPTPSTTATTTAIASRRVQLVLLADLVSQPERWQGRLIRTIGRLQPGQAGVGCTKMACAFPDTARVGDQQPCNRCFGSAVLQDDRALLALAEVRCQGVEILTYRGADEPVDRAIRWHAASVDSRTFSLDQPYVVVGTLRPREDGGAAEPGDAPAFVFQVQSIEPVGSSSPALPHQPGSVPGLW
jgi:hypothetical protein